MRYAFIAQHTGEFHVTIMCRVLQVSKAGYYASRHRPVSAHATRDRALIPLIPLIAVAHHTSRGTYGSPRIHAELRAQGVRCSQRRIARLMRASGFTSRRRRRGCRTTDAQHAHPIAENVLQRHFAVPAGGPLNRGWASDITYIPTQAGWLYLAVVLDLASRRVVGWAMRHTLERGLTLDALGMALAHRQPAPGVLHHSDRGSQYACGDYRARLAAHGMTCSMSNVGDCWDNAVAESFFATLKTELVERGVWRTREEARIALFEYIELWYNRHRRHSSLGYVSPAEYAQQLLRSEVAQTA